MNPVLGHGMGLASTGPPGSGAQQEYVLVGSVIDSASEALLLRLKALCDNVETSEIFRDREKVYVLRGPNQQATVLRARQSVAPPSSAWQLRYIGQSDVSDKSRMVTVRSYQDCATSENLPHFLNEIGFKLDYEFVAEGHMFRKGRLKITVSKLYKFSETGRPDSTLVPHSQSRLVELSVVAPSGSENVAEDMRLFAEQLKPLVIVEKIHL